MTLTSIDIATKFTEMVHCGEHGTVMGEDGLWAAEAARQSINVYRLANECNITLAFVEAGVVWASKMLSILN